MMIFHKIVVKDQLNLNVDYQKIILNAHHLATIILQKLLLDLAQISIHALKKNLVVQRNSLMIIHVIALAQTLMELFLPQNLQLYLFNVLNAILVAKSVKMKTRLKNAVHVSKDFIMLKPLSHVQVVPLEIA